MKIGVVGGGNVGSFLCRILAEQGHGVTLLDSDGKIVAELAEELNCSIVQANGSSAQVLHEMHVEDLDFFFAMTQNDQVNLLAASIAKRMGAKSTVSRIHDSTYADCSYLNYQLQFDIDLFVNPEALAANEIAKCLRNPGRVDVENFGRGEIEIQQIRVSGDSPLVGKSLQEIRLPDGLRIAYIGQGPDCFVPSRDTVIAPFALVTLVGHPQKIYETRSRFKPEFASDIVTVAITGGSEATVALLKNLTSPRFRIKVFEPNRAMAEKLAAMFPQVSIINGSSTSLRLLEEENIAGCDHFVACSKLDEANIMACLQAKKLGVQGLHLLLNRSDYGEVVKDLRDDLHLATIASPRRATTEELLRFICPDPVLELASLPQNSATFYEVRIDPNCRSHNKRICDILLPKNCLIIALLHRFQVKVPSATDLILAGDRLILIANPANRLQFIRALL